MNKKQMLHAMEARGDDYRLSHPATAEMDFAIVRSISGGRSAAQVAMEIPCSESTVYRALRRVKDFLEVPEVDSFLGVLQRHVAENPPNYGNWNAQSILEMLYVVYGECNCIESEKSNTGFKELYEFLRELPLKNVDAVIDKVCDIALYHERDGFTEGVKLGVRLGNELKS